MHSELADLAGRSTRFVHRVENGTTSLQLDKLLDVLEVLGLDLVIMPGSGRVSDAAAAAGQTRAS